MLTPLASKLNSSAVFPTLRVCPLSMPCVLDRLPLPEIVAATGLSQSNVSNHLGCLRECGLVVCEQQGRYVRYQLSDTRVATILRLVEELLAEVAKGVYECTRYNHP